jgi:3-oxoacyl-(acyl-carrier-protein) synthase
MADERYHGYRAAVENLLEEEVTLPAEKRDKVAEAQAWATLALAQAIREAWLPSTKPAQPAQMGEISRIARERQKKFDEQMALRRESLANRSPDHDAGGGLGPSD